MSLAKYKNGHECWRVIFLLCGTFAFSMAALKLFPKPFLWIGVVWIGASVGLMSFVQESWRRALLFNIAFVVAMLTAAEAYASFLLRGPAAYWAASPASYPDGYFVRSDVLGFAPAKDMRARSTKSGHTRLLYDVTYSIGSDGLRVAPPIMNDAPRQCILFFGDSFTFGEGLQDNETLPYQVGIQSKNEYRTFNFGFSGYGPHQMLAEIEQGTVRRVVNCRPDFAIYTAIPDHVARVAGKVPYGDHAPMYQLTAKGDIRLAGYFEAKRTVHSPVAERVFGQLKKSVLFRILMNRESSVSQSDVRLLLATVAKSKELLQLAYPGIQFHIILWESWQQEHPMYLELRDQFAYLNIPVHLIDHILPGYTPGPSKYVLSEFDRHPSALANRMIASYVLTKIISENRASIEKGSDN